MDALGAQSLGGRVYAALGEFRRRRRQPCWWMTRSAASFRRRSIAANIAFGARLRSYRFDKYRTTEKPEKKPSPEAADRAGAGSRRRRGEAYEPLRRLGDAVFVVRDLVSEPANVIYPETPGRRRRRS